MPGNNSIIHWVLAMAIYMITCGTFATDTTAYRGKLTLSLGGGVGYFVGKPGVPQHRNTTSHRVNGAFSGRVMWKPEHLLSVGIESGYNTLYSYSIDGPGPRGHVHLTSVPLLLVWSMRITPRLEAFAGWGTYRLTSTLGYLGTVRTSLYSQGYMAAASYRLPLGERFHGAFELKWMNAFVTQHHLLALQVRIDWRFHAW